MIRMGGGMGPGTGPGMGWWAHGGRPDQEARPSWQVYRRLLTFARPYVPQLSISAALLLISTVLALVWPQFIRLIVDGVIGKGESGLLDGLVLLLLGLQILRVAVDSVRGYLMSWTGERIIVDLRVRIARHLMGLSLSYYNDRKTGEILSHVTSDVVQLHSAITQSVLSVLSQVLTLAGGVFVIFTMNWRLATLTLVVAPLVAILAVMSGRRIRTLARAVQDAQGEALGILQESIAEIRTVQAFTRESYETARFTAGIRKQFEAAIRMDRWQATIGPFMGFLIFSSSIIVLWYGGHLVLDGELTVGELLAFVLYMSIVAGPVGGLANEWSRVQQAFGAADRVFDVLDREPEVRDLPGAKEAPRFGGRIAFDRVRFKYGRGPMVLDDVSVEIDPGTVVALVGPSGAGKTTFVNLLGRFYDPIEGAIRVDGADVRSYTVASLREQIAVVPQEPILFGASVRENIRYGRLDATDEEIQAAADAANATEFVRRLPDGFETLVGERGVKLSVGQRQRVAIARALLRDARILLLDEATSSLDNESEYLVQQALDRLMRGRTTIVIAHRLTTVERADRILVLEAGRIVEQGTHAELLALRGLYQRLYERTFATGGDLNGEPAAPVVPMARIIRRA